MKNRRVKNYLEKLKTEVAKQIRDKERGATYHGKGGGLEITKKNSSPKVDFLAFKCGRCKAYGHQRSSSKVCDMKKGNKTKICPQCKKVGHVNLYSIHCLKNPLQTTEKVGEEIFWRSPKKDDDVQDIHDTTNTRGGTSEDQSNAKRVQDVGDERKGRKRMKVVDSNDNTVCLDAGSNDFVDAEKRSQEKSPTFHTPANMEIQLIDETLHLENDDLLSELDEIYDQQIL